MTNPVKIDPAPGISGCSPLQTLPEETIELHTLLQHIPGGVCLLEIGPQIRIIYANPGFFRMIGAAEDSFLLPCALESAGIHPDYLADYENALRKGAREGEMSARVHRIQSGGRWIWRQVQAVRTNCAQSPYPVMLEISSDISDQIAGETALAENRARLLAILDQNPRPLWQVDIEKKTACLYDPVSQSPVPGREYKNFPESLIAKGIVHSDSAENFRRFAADLLAGKQEDSASFIMLNFVNSCYAWFSLSYRMTFDRDRNPLHAVGVLERLPDSSDLSTGLYRRSLPEIVRHHLLSRIRINLTADRVEEFWLNGTEQTSWLHGKNCAELIQFEKSQFFTKTEGAEFARRFDRANLLEAFSRGEFWSSREYRRIDSGGVIRWMSDTINMVRDPQTGEIYLFACFNDIQARHDWETLLDSPAERDKRDGLYTMETAEALAKRLMNKNCAIALIQICGDPSEDGRTEEMERRDDFISLALSLTLGVDCVVGQHKEGVILAFFPTAPSQYDLKRRIEDAFAYIRASMADIPALNFVRFVAGVAMEQGEAVDYEGLLMRAGCLCGLWKNSAMDTVVFPSGEEDWSWLGLSTVESGTIVRQQEIDRPLSKEEQNVAFRCVTSMLTAGSFDTSIKNALASIGTYYKASRVYLLSLGENRKTISMSHEWIGKGKQSIQHVMEDLELSRFPLISRCLREEKPVFTGSAVEDAGAAAKSWCFTAFPLKLRGEIQDFLCVENAQVHQKDAALLGILVPYITKEQERFLSPKGQFDADSDAGLTNFPNLRSYMEVICSLDSDTYSSMGALSLDIPNFSSINSSYGFAYGREMLQYIAKSLGDVFGKSFIFRTWDAEFVVLFPNTILEVFMGRCTRIRTMLQRRYPKQIRIGYTWADGVFSARNLVREAQSIMRCENVGDLSGDRAAFLEEHAPHKESPGSRQTFVAYFQPKIDMRDGSLAGAEALVRGIDSMGNIIPPGQFIETLEKNGTIRELDLYMLESVLKHLSQWKAQGLPPVRVSVNISRFTLFNPTSLASILAIQSHYPEIPADQIELEITETAGDMEKATLASIVDNFREFGIEFDLDDFGSRYANISMFSSIRFNTIKLDRSLVNDLPDNEISRMLVENIVTICKNFGMRCVAEGVETRLQEAALLKAGCVYAQGYYYAKPLPPSKFEDEFLKKRSRSDSV